MKALADVNPAKSLPKSDLLERIELLRDGSKVLLPAFCSDGKNTYNVKMLRAVMRDDNFSILITGQSGTGKEYIFKCIKEYSSRPKEKTRELNCAGLSDSNLVDSALFGHEEGSFTGAIKKRPGLLESCQGGILFLDEIGWLPKATQAKLLRFMETGKYFRLGSDVEIEASNVRIIAATNKKVLANDVENNRDDRDDKVVLLHDLYFRFDHHIGLPTLKARGADLIWFLTQPGFLGNSVFKRISLRMLFSLLYAKWDGNIRQLKKYCEKANFLRKIDPDDPVNGTNTLDDQSFILRYGHLERRKAASYFLIGLKKYEMDVVMKQSYGGDEAMAAYYLNSTAYQHIVSILGDMYQQLKDSYVSFPIAHLQEILFSLGYQEEEYKAESCHPGVLFTSIVTEVLSTAGFPWSIHFIKEYVDSSGDTCYAETPPEIQDCTFLAEAIYLLKDVADWATEECLQYCEIEETWLKELNSRKLLVKFQDWINSCETPKREVSADLEELLTRLGLDARLQAICRYGSRGMSSPKISSQLIGEGMDRHSKDAINKDLAKLRKDHPELADFIPERKPGRQRNL